MRRATAGAPRCGGPAQGEAGPARAPRARAGAGRGPDRPTRCGPPPANARRPGPRPPLRSGASLLDFPPSPSVDAGECPRRPGRRCGERGVTKVPAASRFSKPLRACGFRSRALVWRAGPLALGSRRPVSGRILGVMRAGPAGRSGGPIWRGGRVRGRPAGQVRFCVPGWSGAVVWARLCGDAEASARMRVGKVAGSGATGAAGRRGALRWTCRSWDAQILWIGGGWHEGA